MNKSFRIRFLAALLAIALALPCTGCAGSGASSGTLAGAAGGLLLGEEEPFTPSEGTGLVIVAAKRANTRWPDTLPDGLEQAVRSAFATWYDADYQKYRAKAEIPVLVSDGVPGAQLLRYELAGNTPANLNLQIEDAVRQVPAYLNSAACSADDEGADLLAALAEARALLDAGRGGEIYVIDSGITVTGYFDMTRSDITVGTVQQVVDAIDPAAFCDLNGVNLTFVNLGNVCGGQSDYRTSSAYRTRLEEVWTEILAVRCGAALTQPLHFEAAGGTAQVYCEDGSGLPWVSPAVFDVSGESAPRTVYRIPASSVGFLPDSAEFRDPALAQAVIQAAAEWLSVYLDACPDETVYVVGSIAKTSPNAGQTASAVSRARAEAVAGLLTKYGIPAGRLTVVDSGTYRGSWSDAAEFDDAGQPLPDAQQANRQVVLIPSGSSEAAELAALPG